MDKYFGRRIFLVKAASIAITPALAGGVVAKLKSGDITNGSHLVEPQAIEDGFSNFIVSEGNSEGYSLANRIAEGTAAERVHIFNGLSGTGKSHLLCAIQAKYETKFKGSNLKHISATSFGFRFNRQRYSWEDYDSVAGHDLLLVDSAENLFIPVFSQHRKFAFKKLAERNRRVVLACNHWLKKPYYKSLVEDLTSFKEVDLALPDVELKKALLSLWSSKIGVTLPSPAVANLSRRICTKTLKMGFYKYLHDHRFV